MESQIKELFFLQKVIKILYLLIKSINYYFINVACNIINANFNSGNIFYELFHIYKNLGNDLSFQLDNQ